MTKAGLLQTELQIIDNRFFSDLAKCFPFVKCSISVSELLIRCEVTGGKNVKRKQIWLHLKSRIQFWSPHFKKVNSSAGGTPEKDNRAAQGFGAPSPRKNG